MAMGIPETTFLWGFRAILVVALLVVMVETVAVLAVKYAIWLWRLIP